jgi:DNA repair protein RadA/Sms
VAGEESAQQIKLRADRIGQQADLAVVNETDVDSICRVIEAQKPSLVVIDSIQTMETSDLSGVAGSIGQVRESAHRLQMTAKKFHLPIFLVGHVTKEGVVAGPKTLEHLVDVVLSLEGDPASNFRILRSAKNRFGPTDEVGVFEMVENGMVEVKNPSKIFLEQKVEAPGSAVTATLTGQRPLLVEIQALSTKSFLPQPRRTGSGVDYNRLQLLVAVLTKRLGLPLFDQDIFVNVTGGLRVYEPGADLAICLAIISSFKDCSIAPKTVLIGEVGLLGELRPVREIAKREKEAKKLGFTKIISSEDTKFLTQAVKLVLK